MCRVNTRKCRYTIDIHLHIDTTMNM
jgi:hypothetical protein